MNSKTKIFSALLVILFYTCSIAQIKNAKTETVKIYGNCGMCKTTIEKAGDVKKTSKVIWNEDSKVATLTYNSKTTNQDAILKRIALVGYDSDKFLAPDDAYAKLPQCCKYQRNKKEIAHKETSKNETHHSTATSQTILNPLKIVFEDYFSLKDALVKTDGNVAVDKSKALLEAINAVKMETLTSEEHTVWMKIMKDLNTDASNISQVKDIQKQRSFFMTLSNNMYQLIKTSKNDTPIYYQHCPMANDGKGADWLSKENEIKNPYFGSQMMSCGKTTETIK